MRRSTGRTQLVWFSFFAAMTLVAGLFGLGESGLGSGFLVATNLTALDSQRAGDSLIPAETVAREWSGIVIHHLGLPAANVDRVHRLHLSYGCHGLGYHFLIGNGSGLRDGSIFVGYRWKGQLPGAHVAGPHGDAHNRRSVGICLIGNGDRRPFTERQVSSLVALVRRLQKELDLPAEAVYLHNELAPTARGPGRFFPTARFREQLLQ